MTNTYEHLQAGDEIGLSRSNGYGGEVRIVKVLRRTKTRVIINPLHDGGESIEFRATNGQRVGPHSYREWELYPLGSAQRWLARAANEKQIRSEIGEAITKMDGYWAPKNNNIQQWLQDPETRAKAITELRATADALEQIK